MLNAPTLDQLQALKLAAMATAWTEQQQQAEMTALAFDERFALLVDAEWRTRENKRLTRALQDAKLKLSQACLEAIDYPARRELDTSVDISKPAIRGRGKTGHRRAAPKRVSCSAVPGPSKPAAFSSTEVISVAPPRSWRSGAKRAASSTPHAPDATRSPWRRVRQLRGPHVRTWA